MFEGTKTYVFWFGLVIFALASIGLFSLIWINVMIASQPYGTNMWESLKFQVPFIIGAIVFILIGFYMMKSGTKPET